MIPPATAMRKIRELYFLSPVYAWRLGANLRRTDITPVDLPWPGDPENGQNIINELAANADAISFKISPNLCSEDTWKIIRLHGFLWLRDLTAVGGEAARLTGRNLIDLWIRDRNRWHPQAWRADILGERLTNWLSTFDFFVGSADQQFRKRVLDSIARQAAHAPRDLSIIPEGMRRMLAIRGLVLSTVALAGDDSRLVTAEDMLLREIDTQINTDGGHRSRSPAHHCKVLMALIDIRNGLRIRGRTVPPKLDDSIDRMALMLPVWRHGDNNLAQFHHTPPRPPAPIDSILAWSDTGSRIATDTTDTGYQRLTSGRTCIIVDIGMPAMFDVPPYASPLAMEMSVGKQRLVANCGTALDIPVREQALRLSSAHSMLTINDADAPPIFGKPPRLPTSVTSRREQIEDGTLVLRAEHDGFRERFGLICQRRLRLSDNGETVEGEDRLIADPDPGTDLPERATIRFHLCSGLKPELAADGRSVRVDLPSCGPWIFWSDADLGVGEWDYFTIDGEQKTGFIHVTKPLHSIRETGEIAVRWKLYHDNGRRQPIPDALQSQETEHDRN